MKVKHKPQKVYTPGSRPAEGKSAKSPRRGRPKKANPTSKGISRKGNYWSKYTSEAMEQAIQDVKEERKSLNQVSKLYKVFNILITYILLLSIQNHSFLFYSILLYSILYNGIV